MDNTSTVKSEIILVYPNAGLRFIMSITPVQEGDPSEVKGKASLSIQAKDNSGQKSLTFTEECSPILGDFIGGFVRWLSTIGVTAAHNREEITGSFRADYTVPKLIQASGAICDMIDHRFSLYQESIFA